MFENRTTAGAELAQALDAYRDANPLVIALPRGGVPVAAEVARRLNAPLEVLIVRKLGSPENPEYAIGALAEGGEPMWRERALRETGVEAGQMQRLVASQREEIRRRVERYRHGRPPAEVRGRTVLVVDDGLATGATMMAAVISLRARGAARIIVAVPAAAASSAEQLRREADEVVALIEREDFYAVGQWYRDFHQVEDEDVVRILDGATVPRRDHLESMPVRIPVDHHTLPGDLTQPAQCRAWVIFAHGSGSSRKSPRNVKVARSLNEAGFGTLLFDLLSHEEEQHRGNVFDVRLLTQRLLAATMWLRDEARGLPIAYFGASTGAAAALCAAAAPAAETGPGDAVAGVVSRGGRPDLAGASLERVRCPVLLLVGGDDFGVLELNEEASKRLPQAKLVVVPGATHLFEEPGALDAVIRHVVSWLGERVAPAAQRPLARHA